MKFLLAPDSFKGTLSAREVCRIETESILRLLPDAKVRSLPMADGGEGMVQAFLSVLGGEVRSAAVTGPLGGSIRAEYGVLPDGCAVIEMAAAAGLPLVQGRTDPLHTTTFGVGELILDAIRRGSRKILLGLGGSCTNDCGIGMAAALGYQFQDISGQMVEPLAVNLGRIAWILPPKTLPDAEILAACDVDNPLLGIHGATRTFGPQKGADEAMLEQLEAGMTVFEQALFRFSGVRAADLPGAGAAGGMGAAVRLLLGGTLESGIDLLLDTAHFDELAAQADIVFTGEGRIDAQSAHGKVPMGIGLRCRKAGVPCIALCGSIGEGARAVYNCGITAIFSSVEGVTTFEKIQKAGGQPLALLTESVVRTLCAGQAIQADPAL